MKLVASQHGSVTDARGFTASGVHAGLKKSGLDMALIVSDRPAAVAGTFTSNKVQGAPVRLCRQRIKGGLAQAIIVNSKNANACTGDQGRRDAEAMAALTAQALGIEEQLALVCSTGVIGVPLPMERIATGIVAAAQSLSVAGGADAMRAIMTTDTVEKQASFEFTVDGRPVRLGGIAKGSGMIEPNMATMLAFLTTDASIAPSDLQTALSVAVNNSFNKITVDGDQSCNDTVLLLANGAAGGGRLDPGHVHWPVFVEALNCLTLDLARQVVRDGEGATKFVTVEVRGAASNEDAGRAARAIANSLLVKTSWFGEDANWGRIIDVAGYCGAELREDLVDIAFDDLVCVRGGCLASGIALRELKDVLARKEFRVTVDLHLGTGRETLYTCDCSLDYVRINSAYTT